MSLELAMGPDRLSGSTPLTLCLVVAGPPRQGFDLLDGLLATIPLTMRSVDQRGAVRHADEISPARERSKAKLLGSVLRRLFGARGFLWRVWNVTTAHHRSSANEGARRLGRVIRGHWRGRAEAQVGLGARFGARTSGTQGSVIGRHREQWGGKFQPRVWAAGSVMLLLQLADRSPTIWPRSSWLHPADLRRRPPFVDRDLSAPLPHAARTHSPVVVSACRAKQRERAESVAEKRRQASPARAVW